VSYVERARDLLIEELGSSYACEPELVDLYTVLVLTLGEGCLLEDVHEAWAVWEARHGDPAHRSIVPFGQLTLKVQEYDRPYRDAIRRAAARLELP
jgi:hypothetical protein